MFGPKWRTKVQILKFKTLHRNSNWRNRSKTIVVTISDIIVELHDQGGWNFVEIAEFLGYKDPSDISSLYNRAKTKRAWKRPIK